jgi:hypothetical protein
MQFNARDVVQAVFALFNQVAVCELTTPDRPLPVVTVQLVQWFPFAAPAAPEPLHAFAAVAVAPVAV